MSRMIYGHGTEEIQNYSSGRKQIPISEMQPNTELYFDSMELSPMSLPCFPWGNVQIWHREACQTMERQILELKQQAAQI